MRNFSVKVCRVHDIHTARFLARSSVDFIGLHAIFGLPSRQRTAEFNKIVQELHQYYPRTRSVLVTRIDDTEKLLAVWQTIPTDFVQWSAPVTREAKESFLRFARKTLPSVELFNVVSSSESDMYEVRDTLVGKYVVVDKKYAGGTGTQTDQKHLAALTQMLRGKYVLVAGGMGRVDVHSWLSHVQIAGVDIMSSMEVSTSDTRKDPRKLTAYLLRTRRVTKLPIMHIPTNKPLTYDVIKDVKRAARAIKQGVDFLNVVPDSVSAQTVREVCALNPFVPIITGELGISAIGGNRKT